MPPASQSVSVVSIILSVLVFLMYLPMMAYGFVRLWQFRHHVLISKRYPTMTFCAILALQLHCITLVFQVYEMEGILVPYSSWIASLRFISVGIFYISFLLRFYLLYYNINWIMETNNQNWKQIINPKFKDATITHQWFIANRLKYGNSRRMRKIGVLVAFIYCPALTLNSYLASFTSSIVWIGFTLSVFLLFIPFLTMVLLWTHTPKFYDLFWIRSEMRKVFLCGVLKYLAYVTFLTIHLTDVELNFESDDTAAVFFIFQAFFAATLDFITVMYVTLWVLKKMIPIMQENPELSRLNSYKKHSTTSSMFSFKRSKHSKHSKKRSKASNRYEKLDSSDTRRGLKNALEIVQFSSSASINASITASFGSNSNDVTRSPTASKIKTPKRTLSPAQGAHKFSAHSPNPSESALLSGAELGGAEASFASEESIDVHAVQMVQMVHVTGSENEKNKKKSDAKSMGRIGNALSVAGRKIGLLAGRDESKLAAEMSSSGNIGSLGSAGSAENKEVNVSIYNILRHDEAFALFISHLNREFSQETILSVVEIGMFVNAVLEWKRNESESNEETKEWMQQKKKRLDRLKKIEFNEAIPTSWIVFEKHENEGKFEMETCRKIAVDLYEKYVKPGSEFEVNISSQLRRHFVRMLDTSESTPNGASGGASGASGASGGSGVGRKFDLMEMLEMFDECNRVNLRLMRGALVRFKKTNEFALLSKFMLF